MANILLESINMKDKKVNLYIGNHGKTDGVLDFINIITMLMSRHGINIMISSKLDPHAINIIIDEFTNYIENRRLAEFRRAYPGNHIVILLTEFVQRKYGITSLNNFGNIFEASTLALADVYLRIIRDDFGRVTPGLLLKLLIFLPLLTLQLIPAVTKYIVGFLFGRNISSPLATFMKENHHIIYLHMRYLGLLSCVNYADALIASHEKIIDGFLSLVKIDKKKLCYHGVLYPEFNETEVLDKFMIEKKLFIEITGSITPYRQKWVRAINRAILILGIHNVFGYCQTLSFSKKKAINYARGAFSLHPPQTRAWAYCSPMRIFRAISVDHNLPILTKHFYQNPIEDICFLYEGKHSMQVLFEMYNDPVDTKNFIAPRLKSYNKLAYFRNNDLIKKLFMTPHVRDEF